MRCLCGTAVGRHKAWTPSSTVLCSESPQRLSAQLEHVVPSRSTSEAWFSPGWRGSAADQESTRRSRSVKNSKERRFKKVPSVCFQGDWLFSSRRVVTYSRSIASSTSAIRSPCTCQVDCKDSISHRKGLGLVQPLPTQITAQCKADFQHCLRCLGPRWHLTGTHYTDRALVRQDTCHYKAVRTRISSCTKTRGNVSSLASIDFGW